MAKDNVTLKDKKISIWQEIWGENALGSTCIIGWQKIHPGKLWAHYRQTSAKEYFQAVAVNYDEDAIFTINYRNDIKSDFVILYNHKVYNINRIDDYEGYKRDIRLYAKNSEHDDPSSYKGMIDD